MLRWTRVKKGMAMNYIVKIAILLVLFLVIVFMIGQKFKLFGTSQQCKSRGGNCNPTCKDTEIKLFTEDCPNAALGKKNNGPCCLPKSEVGF
ncbi:MAG: hypothetical protein QGH47_05070 [Candidatus Woesearchaeota archaeon]|jgi:hypothetical protein|nr:hypothetical protein [Candidatus Woesearchaeota archaeon]|tara:strand:- start:168 stop:443 length:276 start_codon:yes stop_codon:yes gene_type:complete